jgi:site-specific DNA recombinase
MPELPAAVLSPSIPESLPVTASAAATEEGLAQEFNTLDAQRESGESYVKSKISAGWEVIAQHYGDGGYSGGKMARPALNRLMADVKAAQIDCVIVYKVDRLRRSLLAFSRRMEVFDEHQVAFV